MSNCFLILSVTTVTPTRQQSPHVACHVFYRFYPFTIALVLLMLLGLLNCRHRSVHDKMICCTLLNLSLIGGAVVLSRRVMLVVEQFLYATQRLRVI